MWASLAFSPFSLISQIKWTDIINESVVPFTKMYPLFV